MFLNAKSHTLPLNETTMDYVSFGRGDKPLILIPGLSFNRVKGAALSLAFIYRLFAKNYTVYVIDRREHIPQDYTIRDMARDTALAMNTLGLANAHVIGVSQGGMIAQYLAAEHPELVEKLVLGVTAANRNDTMINAVEHWIVLAETRDFKGIVEDMMTMMYSEAYLKRYRWLFPLLTAIIGRRDMDRFTLLAKACLTCDARELLPKIQCPVFVIGGREDKIVTGEASEEIAGALNCEIYMYDRLGHAAYEEAGDFNRRVHNFLQR